MFKFILIYSLLSFHAFSFKCDLFNIFNPRSSIFNNLESSLSPSLDMLSCQSFKAINKSSQVDKIIRSIVQNQTNAVLKIHNRHVMGETLNQCTPSKDSKALVISFAGTAAYNPRSHNVMAKLIQCPEFQNLESKLKKFIYSKVLKALKQKKSKFINWSGIDKGLMSEFLINPKFKQLAKDFNFATFASEESELIADPSKFSKSSVSSLAKELGSSLIREPQGVLSAISCTQNYFMKAKELSINPKLIVVAHSSGSRSAVKFLESISGLKESNLTITLDPVIEVQKVIPEVALQKVANIKRRLNGEEELPVNVWSKPQPKKLYEVNTAKWINFYQQSDVKGLGMSPSFGIQGSPVKDAENIFINNLGDQAHGEITYNKKTLNMMTDSIIKLFPNQSN